MSRLRAAVPPQAAADYDILVEPGLLRQLPHLLRTHSPAASYAIVSDANVAVLYGEPVVSRLQQAGLAARLHAHAAGDAAKTLATWGELAHELLAGGLGRDGCVIGLGGGVSGDIAGFLAASLHRGVAFVQVPTSLLAMVDASVGGKTGVNTPRGKNLVGAFLPPRLVAIDPEVLRTLPERELRSGSAEVVKHGAILDRQHLEEVRRLAPRLLAGDPDVLRAVVLRSVELKAGVVARDPLEAGERAILNFGHTVGHALERVSDYLVPHGFAVAAGMVVAACAGELAGVTEAGTARELATVLAALGLPLAPPPALADSALLAATSSDKKARLGRSRYVLLRRPGEVARPDALAWTFELEQPLLRAALSAARALAAP
jgi:3-dehydroquinate synthase